MDPEQNALEPSNGTDQRPEGDVAEPQVGQTAPKTVESPEDVAKARAYYQQQTQEKAAQLKTMQSELEKYRTYYGDLMEDEPAPIQGPVADRPEIAPSPQGYDDETTEIRNRLAGVEQMLREQRAAEQARAAREAQKRQAEMNRRYAEESETATKALTQYTSQNKIPQEVVAAAVAHGRKFADDRYPGGPSRVAQLAGDFIERWQLQEALAGRSVGQEQASAARLGAVNALAQPSGGGIVSPQGDAAHILNKRYADAIADDDPPVG